MLIVLGIIFAFLVSIGTGGGMLLIPVLTILMGYPMEQAQHTALLIYIPVSMLVTAINIKRGFFNAQQGSFVIYLLLGIAGVAAGTFIAERMDTGVLRYAYAVFIIIAGLWQLIGVFKRKA